MQDTPLRKGEQTRIAIVDCALELAARVGLEGLTIGMLAERMGMSKSGVFAHFGSREELQLAVLKAYGAAFVDDILRPALQVPRGLARLEAIFERWAHRTALEAQRGCILISGASEYDDRPGAVRDALVAMVRGWKRELARAIAQTAATGELAGDIDAAELVFELYGVILALHHDTRLLGSVSAPRRARRSFIRLMSAHGARFTGSV